MKNQISKLLVFMLVTLNFAAYAQQKVVFNFTGSDQYYTIPAGVTEITVKAWGAGGAGGNYAFNDYGGGGGFATGVLKVTPGETIKIIVGGGGKINTGPGAYGGGGAKYNGYQSKGGRGGGRSAIRNAADVELLTAGAGGGGGGCDVAIHEGAGGGGGLTGGNGNFGIYDGQPGTQTMGGVGGRNENTLCPCGSNDGIQFKGGDADAIDNGFNGSGGGGYYGGGSGTDYGDGGGGGGSSFIPVGGCTIGATNFEAANNTDFEYKNFAGFGGQKHQNGKNGRVVIYTHGFRVGGIAIPISAMGACDGSINFNPIDGTPPYTYLWDDGYTNASRNNICPGSYYITITDAMGCFKNVFRRWFNPQCNMATIAWAKTYGGSKTDVGYNLKPTSDGGFILCGYSNSSNGDVTANKGGLDYWLVKTDSLGNMQWQNNYGGSANDYGTNVVQTFDNGYIVIGNSFSNDGDVSGNHGSNDIWVMRIDSAGNLVWQRSLGGSDTESTETILLNNDGSFFIAGYTRSANGDVTLNKGGWDYWIIKMSDAGNIIWQKTYGGSSNDYAFGMSSTFDGCYVLNGNILSNDGDVTGNHGQVDAWVIKIDSTGTLLSQKTFGGSGRDFGNGIFQTSDSGYVIAAQGGSNDGDMSGFHGGDADYWMAKLDANFNIVWQKCFGGTGSESPTGFCITNNNLFALCGHSNSNDGDISLSRGNFDYWLAIVNETGDLVCEKSMGGPGSDYNPHMVSVADGLAINGYSGSKYGNVVGNQGGDDFWTVKLSLMGFNISAGNDKLVFNSKENNEMKNAINVFPNPARDVINILFYSDVDNTSEIKIYNQLGKVIMQKNNVEINGQLQIDVSALANGMYTISIATAENLYNTKFVVNK